MVTIFSLCCEMQSFVNVPKSILNDAKKSKINIENSNEFAQLCEEWMEGVYDEDPNEIVNCIGNLL